MSRRWVIATAIIVALAVNVLPTHAKSKYRDCSYMCDSGEQYLVECTAYCDCEQPTATGTKVRLGVAAFSPSLYGKSVAMWNEDRTEFLGWFEIEDTGSSRIRNGEVIDIWLPLYDDCIEWGRQKVWIEVITAYG